MQRTCSALAANSWLVFAANGRLAFAVTTAIFAASAWHLALTLHSVNHPVVGNMLAALIRIVRIAILVEALAELEIVLLLPTASTSASCLTPTAVTAVYHAYHAQTHTALLLHGAQLQPPDALATTISFHIFIGKRFKFATKLTNNCIPAAF